MMWRRAALKGAWPPPIFPGPQVPPEPHTSRPGGRGRPRDRGPLWQPWPTCAGPTLRIDPGAPRSGSGPERRGFGLGSATRRRVRSWSTCLTSTRATGGRFCLFAGAFCPGHCTMPQMWALDCLARAGPPARHPAAFQARQPCRLGHRWGTAGSTSPRLLSLPDHARTTGPLCGPTSQTACRCLQAAGPVARDHRRNRPWPRLAPGRRARHQIRRHQTAPGLPSPRGRRNEGQVVRRGRLAAARRFEHGMSGKTRGGEGIPDVGQINSRVASIFRAGLGPGARGKGPALWGACRHVRGPGPPGPSPPRTATSSCLECVRPENWPAGVWAGCRPRGAPRPSPRHVRHAPSRPTAGLAHLVFPLRGREGAAWPWSGRGEQDVGLPADQPARAQGERGPLQPQTPQTPAARSPLLAPPLALQVMGACSHPAFMNTLGPRGPPPGLAPPAAATET